MKKWMAAIGLVVLLLVGVMPATVTNAAPTVSGSVWVGGVELDSIGESVASSNDNGGSATLYWEEDYDAPFLVLDNYVYEGSGYEYETGCYAGIYYSGTAPLYIILGTSTSGKASDNSITITAENATESYGIYVDTSYTSNLFIGGSENDAADILTVTGGTATTQSSGIKVTNGIKIISTYEDVYTSADAASTKFYADGNFTVNAIGGTVTGNGACSVGMDLVQGASWNDSTFAKGTFNATGGEASNGISYGIRNSVVINEDTNLFFVFSGATVTATGGTGKSGSYGITGKEVSIEGGTVTAKAGNSTGDSASTSAGISCTTLNVSGGTVNATGGTAEGYSTPTSYGINCSGDATFSGGKITATGGKASYEIDSDNTVLLHEAKTYGIYADTMTISGAVVTATGETCGGHVPGANRNLRYSYGCYGNITMTDGSLIAIGGNLLMEDTTTGARYSYGIYGGITATSGTIEATGGNTRGGESYGIYLNKDSSFSGDAEVTATTKTESTDDYRYGIYAEEPHVVMDMTIIVKESASVTANVAEEARLGTSGIYVYSSYITFIQTGGTVVASAPTKKANQAGAYFMNANISGGTFNATAKTMAFYADELNLTGGVITGTANSTLDDTLAVASTGVQIGTLTMTAGSITGQGGESSTSASYGVRIGTSATVSDGTITGTGGRVSSGNQGVMSYGIEAPGLTLSGGTVTGTGGQASGSSYGVYVTSRATLSEEAVLVGDGGVSDGGNSTGIFGKNFSVADSASVTGTGGQASNGNSTGISLSEDFVMSAGSSAQVTGTGGSGNSSRGIYLSCDYTLAGGTLTATGGTPYTTESVGIYLYYYDFLMGGTLVTATGYTNAVGGDDKFVHSEAMAASANMDGSNRVELQYGSYLVSSLAKYKYLNAGTTEQLGFTPGERDISDAEIILGPTLTYSGEAQTMTVTSVMLGGVDLLEEGWVTVTNNTVTDAGTHTLTVTATEESYYTGSATKEFTVNPLTITPIVTVKEASYPYDSTIDPSDVIVKHGETELVYEKDCVEVTLTNVDNESISYKRLLVGNSATYSIDGVMPGTYTLKVDKAYHMDSETTVVVGEVDVVQDVTLVLGSGDKQFKINSAYLNLNQDINVVYRTTVPDGFTNPYMRFEFCDREEIVDDYFIDANGRLCFAFAGVNPQRIGENICATLYATIGGCEVSVCIPSYSVRQYCVNQLNKNPDANLLRLVSDLLVYGEKTQIYQDYKTEELVTEGLVLSPSVFSELGSSYNVQQVEGTSDSNVRYSGAGLTLSNDMTLRLKITSTNPSAYTYEVSINGRTSIYTYEDLEDNGDGTYYLYFRAIKATEFDAPITAVIKQEGMQVSQKLTYSVCTYIQKNQNSANTKLSEMLKAIYNYGEAAKLFAN